LVEPLGSFVDVVVGACIGTSYDLQSFRTDPLGVRSRGGLTITVTSLL
jgi:hypothetical protein